MLTRFHWPTIRWCIDCGATPRLSAATMVIPPHLSFTVLIVSPDVTAAALIGALVEMLAYPAEFALITEGADASVRRLRPRIYMIDSRSSELCSDEVVGRALMRGVSVVLFGPMARVGRMRKLAERHDAEVVNTPLGPGPLGEALRRAARKSG